MSFYQINIKDFADISNFRFPEYWIFRGQGKDWPLKSSIERLFDKLDYDYSMLEYLEQQFIDEFQRMTGQSIGSKLECLALMQHYGMPTRFLDVSKSLLKALYFTVSDSTEANYDGIIWAINLFQLHKCHVESGRLKDVNTSDSLYVCNYKSENITSLGKVSDMIIPLEPQEKNLTLNTRFIRQEGKFLIALHGSLEYAMFHSLNLEKRSGQLKNPTDFCNAKLIKFIVPALYKENLLRGLECQNINREYLFPKNSINELKYSNICSSILSKFTHD
jgi:hypothetical protein